MGLIFYLSCPKKSILMSCTLKRQPRSAYNSIQLTVIYICWLNPRWLWVHPRFSVILRRDRTFFFDCICFPVQWSSSKIGSTLDRKGFAPTGANSLLLELTPTEFGGKINNRIVAPPGSVPFTFIANRKHFDRWVSMVTLMGLHRFIGWSASSLIAIS